MLRMEKMRKSVALRASIVENFAETKNVMTTAVRMKIDPNIVRYHLSKAGIEMPKGSYRARPPGKSNAAPLSGLHCAVGAKIGYLRTTGGGGSSAMFAEKIGLSTRKYSRIERGQSDITLSELAKIAEGLGIEIINIFEPLDFERKEKE